MIRFHSDGYFAMRLHTPSGRRVACRDGRVARATHLLDALLAGTMQLMG
jgi:hypothetical protein